MLSCLLLPLRCLRFYAFFRFSGGLQGDCSGKKRWPAPAKLKLFYLTSQLKLLSASTSINSGFNSSTTKQHAKERIDGNDSHKSGRGSDVGETFQTLLDAFTRDTIYARYGVVMRRLRGNDETFSETTSRERAKVGEGQRHIGDNGARYS